MAAVARGNIVLVPGPDAIGKDGAIDPSKLERVEVTLGRNDSAYIEITSGLEEGDTIVIEQSYSSIWDTMMGMGGAGPAVSVG